MVFEADFMPPCTDQDAAFVALRESDVRLLMPAELLYPEGISSTVQSDIKDPLLALMDCAGQDQVAAVVSYDEAILNRIPLGQIERLYQHVKSQLPEMPVMMVHAPLQDNLSGFDRLWWRNRYQSLVLQYSEFADVIGFDVYPIPEDIAQLTAISGRTSCSAVCLVEDYAQWLQKALPGKERLMVLQGFSYVDLFDPDYLANLLPADVIAGIHPPNKTELLSMLDVITDTETEYILWWGQGSLAQQTSLPWADIIDMIKQTKGQ